MNTRASILYVSRTLAFIKQFTIANMSKIISSVRLPLPLFLENLNDAYKSKGRCTDLLKDIS